MKTLLEATTDLADCSHPEDQHQHARTTITGRNFIRCADCGAVSYEGEPGRWTRPILVAHVVGATNHETDSQMGIRDADEMLAEVDKRRARGESEEEIMRAMHGPGRSRRKQLVELKKVYVEGMTTTGETDGYRMGVMDATIRMLFDHLIESEPEDPPR